MPRLQYAPDRSAEHRPQAEGDADPRAGALHEMQGLLAASRSPVQTQPFGRAAADEDFSRFPAIDMVAGGAITRCKTMNLPLNVRVVGRAMSCDRHSCEVGTPAILFRISSQVLRT